MIPAGLVNDAKKVNSFHNGKQRAVRTNTQKAKFVRSSDGLASLSSIAPSVVPSVTPSVSSPMSERSPDSPSNPPLPRKSKTTMEKGYAPENAFKNSATSKKVQGR
jgi:hypothetical protein